MGRTHGKLIPFLLRGLIEDLYPNLYYDKDYNREVFVLEFPRYDKSKPFTVVQHERILKDWHVENGRMDKYDSYPIAKAAFQASLKKSIYLIEYPKINKKLRFRKATPEESKEKYRLLKERERSRSITPHTVVDIFNVACDEEAFAEEDPAASGDLSFYANCNPPSVESSGSSGYESGPGDDLNEIFEMLEKANEEFVKFPENPTTLQMDSFDIVNYFCKNDANSEKNDQLQNTELDFLKLQINNQQHNIIQAVEEITATSVDISAFVRKKTYWLCTKKMNVDSTLLLICEKQAVEEGNQIAEGTIIIPNGVWEEGVVYDLKKSFEFDEKQFLFLSPQSV